MKTYTITRVYVKTTPKKAICLRYLLSDGTRMIAEVAASNGNVKLNGQKRFHKNSLPIPAGITQGEIYPITLMFLMFADAFGRKTAEDWAAQAAIIKNLSFSGTPDEKLTESDLFELILAARQRKVHA